jgi:predicted nucleic acid-binding protein
MKIVIDTNVLMAGLLKESVVRTILLSRNISFFLPEYALSEIKKYENELLTKSGYSKGELIFLMNSLLQNIKIVPWKIIKSFMGKQNLL